MKGRQDFGASLLKVVLAGVFAAGASVSWAGDHRACVTAIVPEAFTLPDGSVHAGGRLIVCAVKALNPVVELQRVSLDGGGGGLVMSRRSRAEATADSRAALLFLRAPGAPLDFVGYVYPAGRTPWTYTLQRSDPSGLTRTSARGAVRSMGKPDTPQAADGDRVLEPR